MNSSRERRSNARDRNRSGDAETVAQKTLYLNEALGGLSRITFQMGVSALSHQKMLRSIELLGTRVAPVVRKELTAGSGLSS
jgi:hypothetical protein